MRTIRKQVEVETFSSEVDESVVTESRSLAEVIQWADALRNERGVNIYELVKSTKSRIFGRSGSAYLGCMRGGTAPETILERISHFRSHLCEGDVISDGCLFFHDRALFSLQNFKNKKLKTVFIQQHAVWFDGKEYARACVEYDILPEKQEDILDRFCVWMDSSYRYANTSRITIDGKTVRTFEHDKTGKVPVQHSCSPPSKATVGLEWTCECGVVWVFCEADRWGRSEKVSEERTSEKKHESKKRSVVRG